MWKWVVGVLLVIVLALGTTCYVGYRRLTEGGNTVTTTIAGNPATVFALLTTPDSMLAWLRPGSSVTPVGKGAPQPGDTIRVTAASSASTTAPSRTRIWVVREVRPPTLYVADAVEFNRSGTPFVTHTERDSVFAVGDSTRIVSTFSMSPAAMTARAGIDSGRPVPAGGMLSVAEKMMAGAVRVVTEAERKQLKTYVEHR